MLYIKYQMYIKLQVSFMIINKILDSEKFSLKL